MPRPYSFPVEPPILRQGNPNLYPQNDGGNRFSWNVGYTPVRGVPETRRPSIEATTRDHQSFPGWGPNELDIIETGPLNIYPGDHTQDEWWRQPDSVQGDVTGTAELGTPISDPFAFGQDPNRTYEQLQDAMHPLRGAFPATPAPEGDPIVETPTDHAPQVPWSDPAPWDVPSGTQTPSEMPWSDTPPFDVPSTGIDPTAGGIRHYFGGGPIQSFGNNLTLGEFLNTPLAAMRYGEGYGPVGGGDISYADTTTHTAGDLPSAGVTPEAERQGEIETQRLRDQGLLPPSSEEPPTGRAVSPEVRRAQAVNPPRGTTPGSGAFERGGYGPGYGTGTGIHFDYGSGRYTQTFQHSVGTARDPGFGQQIDPNQMQDRGAPNFSWSRFDEGPSTYDFGAYDNQEDNPDYYGQFGPSLDSTVASNYTGNPLDPFGTMPTPAQWASGTPTAAQWAAWRASGGGTNHGIPSGGEAPAQTGGV